MLEPHLIRRGLMVADLQGFFFSVVLHFLAVLLNVLASLLKRKLG